MSNRETHPPVGGTVLGRHPSGKRSRYRVALCLLMMLPATGNGASSDGVWQLRIEGHQDFVMGEPGFGGGVRIPWEVVIEFEVLDAQFRFGSGSSRYLDRATAISRPAAWFDCRQVDGSYLDSNLKLHQTPRVRFAAFPVSGRVVDGRVQLQPGYEPPGNYLAVTYRCVTENPGADNWLAFSERGKQVLGKRQDNESQRDGLRQSARVREVASLPPEGRLDLPLRDGWAFSRGSETAHRFVNYRLYRIE